VWLSQPPALSEHQQEQVAMAATVMVVRR